MSSCSLRFLVGRFQALLVVVLLLLLLLLAVVFDDDGPNIVGMDTATSVPDDSRGDFTQKYEGTAATTFNGPLSECGIKDDDNNFSLLCRRSNVLNCVPLVVVGMHSCTIISRDAACVPVKYNSTARIMAAATLQILHK